MADATEATLRASNEVLSVRTAVVAAHDNRVKKYVDKFRRRGPTDREFAALRTAVTTCGKIHESCDDLGRTLGTTGKEFDAAKGKAQVVGSRARRIGEINWKEMFDRPPAPLQ